jgi:hypothetical protein
MAREPGLTLLPALFALYLPFCAAEIRPVVYPLDGPVRSLWEPPADLAAQDLFNGPWGAAHAPNPDDRYLLVKHKHSGVNPGMTVLDSRGREWSVKQAPLEDWPDEGPVEVVMSRVLSAVGYHQPPVYYLPRFTLADEWSTHVERGGRFRLKLKVLKDRGAWSWHQNPFVGTRPYHGLLAILLTLNSSDLKNANNTLYEYRGDRGIELRYMVRDLGAALGTTGRFAPGKGDPEALTRRPLIDGVRNGFVAFEYGGWHQELVRDRLTPDDVVWASTLLSSLTERQWQDAFRAGGYPPDLAGRFIRAIDTRVAEGLRLGRFVEERRGSSWDIN